MPLPPIAAPWPLVTSAEQAVLDAAVRDAERRAKAERPPNPGEIVTDPKRRPLR